ncbi:NAD(P)/FAD-dependent oxidoreductase [Chenggangzhangella methanolivorans]|uniref:NAD(P)/FAD-dependent oxidoreductase n=1 Tax=Chenggangzhangella methanolivorans TaxID=1437009 RepID=UPI003619B843
MEILVIGAGVVGLAAARALALDGHDVVVAEASDAFGMGISSRNSEVIHAGMYYPAGSLRARHCVRGARLLYEFCESHGVAHRACGKLIVATSQEEVPAIEAIRRRGAENGVERLELIDAGQAARLEPHLRCHAAVLSPRTGIIDSHALMLALLGDIEDRGGSLALMSPALRLRFDRGRWLVTVGEDAGEIAFDAVVNAAGLGAQQVAAVTEGYPADRIPRLFLSKGSYFSFAGRPVFQRLIYPAPAEGGWLGVHLTLDLAGRVRFGPDAEWIDALDYAVDPWRADAFYGSIRRFWPGLPDDSLTPDYSGVRPKLSGPGEPAVDFRIDGPADHGMDRLVHLFGIDSPGLTSSLSIAETVAEMLRD